MSEFCIWERARREARIYHQSQPPWVSYDELEAAAYVGAWKASENFKASRGASLSTYVGVRARSEMMTWVRDCVPAAIFSNKRHQSPPMGAAFGNDLDDPIALPHAATPDTSILPSHERQDLISVQRVKAFAIASSISEKTEQALMLRLQGHTFGMIAAELGIKEHQADTLIRRLLR